MIQANDLQYYLSLPYRIEIVPIRENEGGGYEAFMPELGRDTVTAAGNTPEEALRNLLDVKETVFSLLIEQGTTIPLPDFLAA